MRPTSLLSALGSALVLAISTLISIGLFEGEIFLVAAVWLIALLFISLLGAASLVYRRLKARTDKQHQLFTEKYKEQNRRYESLALKLDNISAALQIPTNPHQKNSQQIELSTVIDRVQISERRVLGRLENELYSSSQRFRKIDEKLEVLSSNFMKDQNPSDER